jgi:pyridoxine 4-dehydrogenase
LRLRRIDPKVPLQDQIGEPKRLQDEGKVRRIGLCGVAVDQLSAAQEIAVIASTQNQCNLVDRSAQPVSDYCTDHDIAFIPTARWPAVRWPVRAAPWASGRRSRLP